MSHQIRNIYRSIEDLTHQIDYLRDSINNPGYNPLNYTDNPYRYNPLSLYTHSHSYRDPLFTSTPPPLFNVPPYTSPISENIQSRTASASASIPVVDPDPHTNPLPTPPSSIRRTTRSNNPLNINATSSTLPTSNWSSIPYSGDEQNNVNDPPQLFEVVFNRTFTIPTNDSEDPILVTHKLVNENTKLEVFEDNDGNEATICSICRGDIENGDIIRTINTCNHSFHQTCIDKWFEDKNTCPVCRCNLQPENENTEANTEANGNNTGNTRVREIPISRSSESLRQLIRNLRQRYNLPDPALPSR